MPRRLSWPGYSCWGDREADADETAPLQDRIFGSRLSREARGALMLPIPLLSSFLSESSACVASETWEPQSPQLAAQVSDLPRSEVLIPSCFPVLSLKVSHTSRCWTCLRRAANGSVAAPARSDSGKCLNKVHSAFLCSCLRPLSGLLVDFQSFMSFQRSRDEELR